MKVFLGRESTKKSWAIKLDAAAAITAVDAETGQWICYLINFTESGDIIFPMHAFNCLNDRGYDPEEHNNKFDENGRIICTQYKN